MDFEKIVQTDLSLKAVSLGVRVPAERPVMAAGWVLSPSSPAPV